MIAYNWNQIIKDMSQKAVDNKLHEYRLPPPTEINDEVYVIDRKTLCAFYGDKIIHTDACMCGEYQ